MTTAGRIFHWLEGAGILTTRDVVSLSNDAIEDSDAGYHLRQMLKAGKAVKLLERGRWGLIRYAFVKGSTPPEDGRKEAARKKSAAAAIAAKARERKPGATIAFCAACGYTEGERCARFGCKTIADVPAPQIEAAVPDVQPNIAERLAAPESTPPASSEDFPAMLCSGTGRPHPARAVHPRPYVSTAIECAFGSFPQLRKAV